MSRTSRTASWGVTLHFPLGLVPGMSVVLRVSRRNLDSDRVVSGVELKCRQKDKASGTAYCTYCCAIIRPFLDDLAVASAPTKAKHAHTTQSAMPCEQCHHVHSFHLLVPIQVQSTSKQVPHQLYTSHNACSIVHMFEACDFWLVINQ